MSRAYQRWSQETVLAAGLQYRRAEGCCPVERVLRATAQLPAWSVIHRYYGSLKEWHAAIEAALAAEARDTPPPAPLPALSKRFTCLKCGRVRPELRLAHRFCYQCTAQRSESAKTDGSWMNGDAVR